VITPSVRHILVVVLMCIFVAPVLAQFPKFKLPNDLPNLNGKDKGAKNSGSVSNLNASVSGLSDKMVRKELESRLNKLSSLYAWESMDDYDGPIALLMSLLSPEGVDRVKQEYLKESVTKLKNKGTPKLSAESAMNEFARNIAWKLKKIAAKSPYRLTLVLGTVVAKDEAEQSLVDEVFAQLVENRSLTDDYVIISVPRDQANEVIEQVSGSTDAWKAPDGSNSNQVDQQVYHPDSIYVIDGALRQWNEEQTQEFHSEFAARLYHPRTHTMVGGKEIRQDDVYYFHPTRQWISEEEDKTLASKAPSEQPELSLAFKAAVPIARQTLWNQVAAKNDDQAKAGQVAILVNAGARELAQHEYKSRLGKMPAVVAWQDLEQPNSNASTLLAKLSPGGATEARTRYARRARHAVRFQAMPELATHEVVGEFADAVARHMAELNARTGRRPVLVLGEVTAEDARTERMLYDVYAELYKNDTLAESCTIIGLSPGKAQAIINDLSGGVEKYAVPDGSNLSEIGLTEVNTQNMYIVQGAFTQAVSDNGRRFHSKIETSLTSANNLANANEEFSFREEATYYYHPIHEWIPEQKERTLQASYEPERDNGPLPTQLVDAPQNRAAPDQNTQKSRKNPLSGLKNIFSR